MATDHDDTEFEPPHSSSPTDHVLNELQLYGYRPFQDEPDPMPLPESETIASAVADIFDALVSTLSDTRLEPDLENLLWSTVNLFHRAVDRIERELDDNEQAQQKIQRDQNGSEVRSVELERLTAEGITLVERRNSIELFRDQAARTRAATTSRSSWMIRASTPRSTPTSSTRRTAKASPSSGPETVRRMATEPSQHQRPARTAGRARPCPEAQSARHHPFPASSGRIRST